MKLSSLIQRFAEAYVDAHEEEICSAIIAAMNDYIVPEFIAEQVLENMDIPVDEVVEEVMNRL